MSEAPGAVLRYVEALRERIGMLDEPMLLQALEVTSPRDVEAIQAICHEIESWVNTLRNAVPRSPGGKALRREQRERMNWNLAKYHASPEGKEARTQFAIVKPSEDNE